jgi:ribosome biogenesis GTPase A
MVLSDHRKKLVYVLNKADLVPRDILAGIHEKCIHGISITCDEI